MQKRAVEDKRSQFHYEGGRTKEISFPLGGIGTGCIGLAGNGRLIDWEIYNKPNKHSHNGYTFFAVKAERDGQLLHAKVLQGDLHPSYMGQGRGIFHGFGYGPGRETLSGLPHYADTSFQGEFPIAAMEFRDSEDPIGVQMKAFNPYIPLNDRDSSIPAALFAFEVTNHSGEALDVSLAGSLSNPFLVESVNAYTEAEEGLLRSVTVGSRHHAPGEPAYGEIALSTDSVETSHQTYWYRGGWFDNLILFWKDFVAPGGFQDRVYAEPRTLNRHVLHELPNDTAVLCSHAKLQPGETATFRYAITWHFPNRVNDWNPPADAPPPVWSNYYAKLFANALDSAGYVFKHWDRLHAETARFHNTLFRSTLPDAVIDAVSANLSILKSPTVLRLPDGTLYGFEGSHTNAGSCEGSCSHVWGYEQVTPFLFPALARAMRELDFHYAQLDNGQMAFRLMLPPARTLPEAQADPGKRNPAADGQMVQIIRVYREWKVSGDTGWLKALWPRVRKALTFAWDPTNEKGWDRDKDGVMEGIQHHTLDVDMIGPSPFLTGLYHAALACGALMAEAAGDSASASEYRQLLVQGRAWVDAHLFNGEFYVQQVDLQDSRFPLDPEIGELKYQIGGGCHVDQVIGQWHAHLVGAGRIFDPVKTKSALQAIYRHNFIRVMRDQPNFCRIYALNDEQGVLICTWPNDDSPKVPVPYASECMNGFEYQVACHMIYEGMIDEGLEIVRAIRARYDGERRNPWNEFECGSHYVRSMASYSLLLAYSGFSYDLVNQSIGFAPVRTEPDGTFRCFWSLGTGWGEYAQEPGRVTLSVLGGTLALAQFSSSGWGAASQAEAMLGGSVVSSHLDTGAIVFDKPILIGVDRSLVITWP